MVWVTSLLGKKSMKFLAFFTNLYDDIKTNVFSRFHPFTIS